MCNQNQNNAGINWEKSFALIMIVLCAIALIVPFIIQSINHTTNARSIKVCNMDSVTSGNVLSAADAALVFKELEKKEIELSSKYDYALQQRENEHWWQNYVSYVIGIIVAVCGFFGYKSIQDLKQDVDNKITAIAEDKISHYLDEKLDGIVRQKVMERMQILYDPKTKGAFYGQLKDEIKSDLIKYYNENLSELIIGEKNEDDNKEQLEVKSIPEEVRAIEEIEPDKMFNI